MRKFKFTKIKVLLASIVITLVAIFFKFCTDINSSIQNSIEQPLSQDIADCNSFLLENSDTTIQEIDLTISRFLHSEHLTGGASIAVSIDGRIVYAKGIGYSNIEDSIIMQPYNRMRIASVSKLVTAIAIMKLAEEGRISLHQKVFGPLGVLNDDKYLAFRDKRMGNITIYQLLNHSGGWTAKYGDPMFMAHTIAKQIGKDLPISMEDIIRFMQTKSMHFTPGTCSVYSNFGYGILGEVVSKASGMPYEDYVRSEVLAPLGIYDMQIGYSKKSEQLPREVTYYEADTSYVAFDYSGAHNMVRRAYGGTDIQTLGSAGGWVANSVDLLKLILTIDGLETVPDQLSKLSVDTMVNHQLGFDPLGWRTTINDSWYRSGTLAATSAMIARHANGINYVILLNCSNHRGPALANLLRTKMDQAINSVKSWPTTDLLATDERWQYYIMKNTHN